MYSIEGDIDTDIIAANLLILCVYNTSPRFALSKLKAAVKKFGLFWCENEKRDCMVSKTNQLDNIRWPVHGMRRLFCHFVICPPLSRCATNNRWLHFANLKYRQEILVGERGQNVLTAVTHTLFQVRIICQIKVPYLKFTLIPRECRKKSEIFNKKEIFLFICRAVDDESKCNNYLPWSKYRGSCWYSITMSLIFLKTSSRMSRSISLLK